MTISKRLRYEILTRDNNTCRYCHATDTALTIDHVTPTALGGTDDPSNLVAACKDCNAGKSSTSPDAAVVAQVSDDAVRWAAAMQSAAERLAAHKAEVAEQLKPWFDDWYVWSGPGWSYKLPADADVVLTKYLAAGMPLDVLREAARIALRKRDCDGHFRYFQGVANNWLRDLQRDATAILAAPRQATDASTDEWSEGFQAALRDPAVSYAMNSLRDLSAVVDGLEWGWN
ncbi:MAG: HNH endonuclease [Mycobacteriaceae bacterium]